MKKYENTPIKITTNRTYLSKTEDPKYQISFIVDMKNNGHRKTHDYLLAMALGYEIVPMSN